MRRPFIRRNGLTIAPLAPEGAAIEIYEVTYPPAKQPPEPGVHDGHEWLYALGFVISDHIADWSPGLRCGFVSLWPEYLELLTVADEPLFEAQAEADLRADRAHGSIHAARQWRQLCPAEGPDSGVVCLRLLSQDVARTVDAMTAAGWRCGDLIDGAAHLLPHPADGVRFIVQPGAVDSWLQQRREILGEELELRRS